MGLVARAELDDAFSALRARGGRLTRQRALIWDALVEHADGHLSAADVAAVVSASEPRLHQATVYRTLDTLVAEGVLLRTDLGSGRSYYELPAEHRHHHVVCGACGAVAHVHDDELGALVLRVQTASGYSLDERELTFTGSCPTCQDHGRV